MIDIPVFENPKLLWLLLLILPYIVWYVLIGRKSKASLRVSSLVPLKDTGKGFRYYLQHVPFILRCFVIGFMILAIARPRSSKELERTTVEGVDIMLVMDISGSMLAQDFKPDRFNAAKDIAIEFVSQRPADRMGLTVFAGESYVQCPLTSDRTTLVNLIASVQMGLIEDGTAIGNGLATAVGRMKESDAKSRVIILMTDGVNNRGNVSPISAADLAVLYGIRVYTIGIGTNGEAPYPGSIFMLPVEIDEALLKEISLKTGGQYFRATNNTKLLEIYDQINKMEKTKNLVDSFPVYKEEYLKFAFIAFCLLIFEIFIRLFILRRIP